MAYKGNRKLYDVGGDLMCSVRAEEQRWVEGRAGEMFTPTFHLCVTDDPLNSSEGIKETDVNIIKVSSLQFSPLLALTER